MSLSTFVVELLGERGADDALLFPDMAGGQMRGSNMRRRWWSQAVAAAGLPENFKLHEMRHTAASLAIQAGCNIKLQNMLGHESAALALDRYGHLYESDVQAGRGRDEHAFNRAMWSRCGHRRRLTQKQARPYRA